jgi:hypothetical protein
MTEEKHLIATFDEEELALRLLKIGIGAEPPFGATTSELLTAAIEAWPQSAGPFPFLNMAHAAMEYFAECIDEQQNPQRSH